MRIPRILTATVVALIAAATGAAAPAQAAGGFQQIVNTATGKCVDVVGGSTDIGARVHQWSCGSGSSQRWLPTDLGNGFVQFANKNGGRCLSLVWGTLIVDLQPCDAADQRQWWRWEFADVFGNLVLVTPPAGGSACLALLPFSNTNGTRIGIADCATTSAQIWHPQPA